VRWHRLFREAAQLKTVAAAVWETGGKGLRGKIQKYTVGSAGRGCPTVPVVADISCYTFIVRPTEVAVARGGAHKTSSWQLLPYLCLTLAAEACGVHSNVSCGPPRSEASARATLKGRRSKAPIHRPVCRVRPRPVCKSSPPAVSATSSAELQPAAWGGGELRGSSSRKNSTSFIAQFCRVGAARSGGGPKA